MFHPNTQKLIATWRDHRDGRRLPARTDLSPIDLGALLPQVFMLGRAPDGEEVFRLCGGLMADLHGRDLRGSSFYSLWAKLDRPEIAGALAGSRSGAAPLVLTVDAVTDRGDKIGVELCLAPLTGPSGEADRTLGLYQPITSVARLMGSPVRSFQIRQTTMVAELPPSPPRLRLVALDGLRVA